VADYSTKNDKEKLIKNMGQLKWKDNKRKASSRNARCL